MSTAPLKLDVMPSHPRLGQGDLAAHAEAGGAHPGAGSGAGQKPAMPEAAAQQRFEALLAGGLQGGGDALASSSAAALASPLAVGLPSFGFGPLSGPSSATPTPPVQAFADQISRVMVSSDGGGSRQVRLDLDDSALPGVTVTVQEQEGRWQVSFVCRQEPPRLQLSAQAPWMADTLAERLKRDTLVQVRTDDDEDPCLVEALGFEAGRVR